MPSPALSGDAAPSRAALSAYLARAEKLVLDEREASRNQVFSIWMKPIPERVAGGHAIEGIQITGTAGLRAFQAEYGEACRAGLLLHTGTEIKWLTADVLAAPWWRVI